MAEFNQYYDGASRSSSAEGRSCPTNKNRGSGWRRTTLLFSQRDPDEIVSIEGASPARAALRSRSTVTSTNASSHESPQVGAGGGCAASPFIGDTIAAVDFHKTFDVVVVGIWRRHSWIRDRMSRYKLKEATCWCCAGRRPLSRRLAAHHRLPDDVPFSGRPRRRSTRTGRCSSWRPSCSPRIGHRACPDGIPRRRRARDPHVLVSVDHAYREIDVRIFVMIAGVIPLGLAMERTAHRRLPGAATPGDNRRWSPLA